MAIFQFPMGICFEKSLKEYLKPKENCDYFDILPLNNWVEGSLREGIKAFYFGVPTESGQINFRIPIEEVEIFYGSGGTTHLIYRGKDEELLYLLISNEKRINERDEACPMWFEY